MVTEHGNPAAGDEVKRGHAHEGPKNHILAFILSITLTVFAFLAVIYAHVLEAWFVIGFIVLLAFIQALVQAVFWMHLKDRGHFMQRLFLAGGALVAMMCIVMAVYWVWW